MSQKTAEDFLRIPDQDVANWVREKTDLVAVPDVLRELDAIKDLSPNGAAERQVRVAQTSLTLMLLLPGANRDDILNLFWPPDDAEDYDPGQLLRQSENWDELVTGDMSALVMLARARLMKVLAQTQDAPDPALRQEAIALCDEAAQTSASAFVVLDCDFVRAGIKVDRANRSFDASALEDLESAANIYAKLLEIWTEDANPKDHIKVLGNLGQCLQSKAQRMQGPEADQEMERAIRYLDACRDLGIKHGQVMAATNASFNLGAIYFLGSHRKTGDLRDADLTASIKCFADIAKLLVDEEGSDLRVKALVNQALVFNSRSKHRVGSSSMDDLNAAQTLCGEAIEVFRKPGNLGDLARAWSQMGTSHWRMARMKSGIEAQADYDAALHAYQKSTEIFETIDAKIGQANGLSDQAIVLSSVAESKIGREAVSVFDRAISSFESAYAMMVEGGDHASAARIARNLQTAWGERAHHCRRREALFSYSAALDSADKAIAALDKERDARTISEIGADKAVAFLERAALQSGAERLSDYDEAIRLLNANLAMLKMPNDERAIGSVSFNAGLAHTGRAKSLSEPRGRDAVIAQERLQTSLRIFHDTESLAFEPAIALADLLVWQAEHKTPDTKERLALAIEHAERAVRFHDREMAPRLWLRAMEMLARARFLRGEPDAEDDLSEVLNNGGWLVATIPDLMGQETALRIISGAGDRLAFLRAKQGKFDDALAAVAKGRAIRAQRDLLLDKLDDATAALRAEIQSAQAEVSALQIDQKTPALSLESDETAGLQHLRHLLEKLENVITRDPVRRVGTTEHISRELPEHAVAVVLLTTELGGGALLVPSVDLQAPARFLELPGLTRSCVESLTGSNDGGWLAAYSAAFDGNVERMWNPASHSAQRFLTALDDALSELWDVAMGPLDAALSEIVPERGALIVLIPPGKLSGMPLGAATRGVEGTPFLAHWNVTYAQSIAAWLAAAKMASERTEIAQKMLAISDPTEDLTTQFTYARVDGTWQRKVGRDADGRPLRAGGWKNPIRAHVPFHSVELEFRAATVPAILEELPGCSHVAFFCHGGWDRETGLNSGLEVAADTQTGGGLQTEILTIQTLDAHRADLSSLRTAFLVACETAPIGLEIPDEYQGLAHGLSLRVPSVLSTLFPVTPTAATALMGAVCKLHFGPKKHSLPVALARAQAAAALGGAGVLNHIAATGEVPEDPSKFAQSGTHSAAELVPIARASRQDGLDIAEDTSEGAVHSDSHPFYWAAFVVIGA